jgi:dTDP-4-amino-4,6-dideoxygalactose transaminase
MGRRADQRDLQMNIPYVRPSLPDFAAIAPDIEHIMTSGQLTKGPIVAQYEQSLAERLNVRNVIATSSCTIGLALLYRALEINGPVIVPSFTFMATVNALVWAGGSPVFVDVDPLTWTIDPEAVEAAMSPAVRGIVAVPVFGSPCDVDRLQKIADRHAIPLVYDSAHGMGSFHEGTPLGRFGRAEAFSTTPTKTLVTGEGGFVTTNDDELASLMRVLVEYGNDGSFDTRLPGLNGRLPEISALIGLRMLDGLDTLLERRAEIVATYRSELGEIEGVTLQRVRDGCVSSYKDFTITIDPRTGATRDALAARLSDDGIQTKRYFSPVVHRQTPYRGADYEGKLPVTERLESEAISLPLWSGMTDDEVDYVVKAVRRGLTG